MSRTLQLYQLQSLDSEIDQTRQRLVEIAARLGETEALKQAKTALEAKEQSLRKAQTVMQDLDLELKSLTNKITSEERKLYSGKILSAKEAANLQEEVASLKRRQADREETLLEAMVAVEEAEEARDEAQARLAEIEASWQAVQTELKQEQAALKRTLSELTDRRPFIVANISQEDLDLYERLRPKKAGRAVATVKRAECQGCGVEMPSGQVQRARTGTEISYCPTCGRIIYVP